MPAHAFAIYSAYSVTISGWQTSDPSRFGASVPIALDDQAAGWVTTAQITGEPVTLQYGGTWHLSPFHNNVNLPEVQWSIDDANWHSPRGCTETTVGPISIPLAQASPTLYFRLANDGDSLGGILTPVDFSDVNVTLTVSPPVNLLEGVLQFGIEGKRTSFARGFARSRVQVVG